MLNSLGYLLRVARILLTGFLLIFFVQTSTSSETEQDFAEAQSAYDGGDFVTAISKWRELGDRGNVQAQYQVGRMILRAEGTNYDSREATKWLKRSAKAGFAPAQADLADLLKSGQGVKKDPKLAAFWYEAAAAQGNAKAMMELAFLYSKGAPESGLIADEKKATALMQSAAELGEPKAQFSLGLRYAGGIGVARDDYKGYVWQTISAKMRARSDPEEARATLFLRDYTGSQLSFLQRLAAEVEAQKWVDEHARK